MDPWPFFSEIFDENFYIQVTYFTNQKLKKYNEEIKKSKKEETN